MEFNVPKASQQEMSRRDMHLQRESHRQGFVGRFLCNGSSLSGLAAFSRASGSQTPEEENEAILSICKVDTTAAAAEWLKILPLCLDL